MKNTFGWELEDGRNSIADTQRVNLEFRTARRQRLAALAAIIVLWFGAPRLNADFTFVNDSCTQPITLGYQYMAREYGNFCVSSTPWSGIKFYPGYWIYVNVPAGQSANISIPSGCIGSVPSEKAEGLFVLRQDGLAYRQVPVARYGTNATMKFDCNDMTGISDPGVQDDDDLPPAIDRRCVVGMPVWAVSEPFISLWIEDEPLGYQPALGSRISFRLDYNQRGSTAGFDPNIFSVGKKWNFSWLSYVVLDTNANRVVYFAGGGNRTYTSSTDYLTNTRITGGAANGFTVSYPDGSKDVYGFVVTNNYGVFQKAFLTERWSAINQKTRLDYRSYDPSNIVIRLNDVVDGDGRTNTISYVASNNYSTNLMSQVVDAFGRTNSLAYDGNGYLTSITDVAGLVSSFGYTQINYATDYSINSMTTPYGTTSFAITDTFGPTQVMPNGRSILITEPDGGKQLYLYQDSAAGVPYAYTNQAPSTSPFSNNLDNADMNLRNSFHWNRLQYAALSTNDISQLGASDYLKGHLRHWLKAGTNTVGSTLSMERVASPDGSTEGQKTWYDYAGKTNSTCFGTQVLTLLTARVLSDGTSWYDRRERNSFGTITNEVSTYSIGSTVYQRTNSYTYASNDVDLISVTNALRVQVSSNAFNGYHQVLTNYDALNEKTVYTYNTNQQFTSVTWPNGLITTNIYFTSGTFTNWLDRTIDFAGTTYFRTNSFTYGTNGLVYSQTDERGLVVTNFWDNLQRLTGRLYPDGTTISNRYCRLDGQSYPTSSGGTNILDLTATKDRLSYWAYFAYNPVRQQTFVTNALNNVTAFGYCNCGSLEYVTNALNVTGVQQVTHYVHDNQGNVTSIFYPDGSGLTNKYDSLGQLTNILNGFASVTNYYNNQRLLATVSNVFGRVQSTTYDILDRATNSVDANGVTITGTYDNLNRLFTRTYPDTGQEKFAYTLNIAGVTSYTNQLGSNVANYAYDALNRKTKEVNPGITTNSYTYSAASDLLTLTDGKSQVTRWNYDQYGCTTNKVDAANTEIFRYQYDADDRLTNRWSAAKGATTYKYDSVGDLTNVVYPASPGITMKYDALNRLTNMADAVGTTVYGYVSQFLVSEDGPWDNDTVSYTYANRLRSGLTLFPPNASPWTQTYGYDTANRLSSVTSPAGAFIYGYKGPGNLVTNLALPNGSAITNVFDSVARLTGTWLKNSSGSILNSHTYSYNLAAQRTAVTNTAGNYVNYTYDNIGELKTAIGKESGGSSRLNEQFGYVYDAAGNLNYRTNNALIQTFGVNNLNELNAIDRSGTLTVAGATTSAATNVTVNGATASRYNDATFALGGFTVTNGNNTFTAVAQDSYNRKDTNSVTVNLPSTVSYIYDLNGNLTSDGTRGFDYDDENQLIRITATNSWKSEFTYDGKFRRRIRKEYSWINSAWVVTNEVRYIYDGNFAFQERNANNLPTLTLTRTADHLLARSDMAGLTPSHAYFHADGNANITALINGQQIVVAKYVYDPFGNTLSKAGPLADANTYRFSSQEYHQNSGLSLYLYRAYDPNLQRWLNRDPIEELGGMNLSGFVDNNPISFVDPLGLAFSFTVSEQDLLGGQFVGVPGPLPYIAAEGGGKDHWYDPVVGTVNNSVSLVGNSLLYGMDLIGHGIKSLFSNPQDAEAAQAMMLFTPIGWEDEFLLLSKEAAALAECKAAKTGVQVTEANIAKALEGSAMKTAQGEVSLPAVERYVRRLEAGEVPPAIKVDGNVIVDGNHRYVAGRLVGTEPPVTPGTLSPGQAGQVRPIQQTVVKPEDWGNH